MAQLASAGTFPVCQICSQPITRRIRKSRDSGRCCSRACGFELMRRERREGRLLREARQQMIRMAARQRCCVVCGGSSDGPSYAKYCSPQCSARRNFSPIPERVCKECMRTFTPTYGDKRRSFCSELCATRHFRRVAKGVGRAKSYDVPAEPINPILVMERDGWTCHICGEEAPRALRGTMRWNAPELDHIIPLAAGGSHTYDNVACAHRSCNLQKGDALPPGAAVSERRWVHQGMGGVA